MTSTPPPGQHTVKQNHTCFSDLLLCSGNFPASDILLFSNKWKNNLLATFMQFASYKTFIVHFPWAADGLPHGKRTRQPGASTQDMTAARHRVPFASCGSKSTYFREQMQKQQAVTDLQKVLWFANQEARFMWQETCCKNVSSIFHKLKST